MLRVAAGKRLIGGRIVQGVEMKALAVICFEVHDAWAKFKTSVDKAPPMTFHQQTARRRSHDELALRNHEGSALDGFERGWKASEAFAVELAGKMHSGGSTGGFASEGMEGRCWRTKRLLYAVDWDSLDWDIWGHASHAVWSPPD